mmetsp:Transcript_32805/g.64044  ORF Transcript_32805/g.64044 Transcript_32805/m.64044 type:complete len:88 (+) Transcript_32805:698-961(+)
MKGDHRIRCAPDARTIRNHFQRTKLKADSNHRSHKQYVHVWRVACVCVCGCVCVCVWIYDASAPLASNILLEIVGLHALDVCSMSIA